MAIPPMMNRLNGNKCCTIRVFGCLFDLVILIAVLGALALSYSGLIKPRGTGFYCNDSSIKFPYRGDTVSVTQLFLGSLLLPIFFIFPLDLVKKWRKYRQQSAVRTYLLSAWRASWSVWRAVLLGNLAVLVLTEFSKSLVSEARPHFWDSCKPNVTEEMCSNNNYIVEFNCTSDFSSRKISDAQKSFPSGHTSLSAFVALFMMWYLSRAVQCSYSYFLTPVLQCPWAAFAIVCGLTRITDRRHHWWDVLAGFTLGAGVAIMLIQALSRSIRWNEDDDDSSVQSADHLGKDGVGVGNSRNNTELHSASGSSSSSKNKRLSVRRLLSSSSNATTIAEDGEVNENSI